MEECPAENISSGETVNCHCCRSPMHLLCYGVHRKSEEIFVSNNIVMICDGCINVRETSSPKRKQPNVIQSTIDIQNRVMSLAKPTSSGTPPSKANENVKQSHHFQSVVQTLIHKVEVQTATIAGRQASVDSMSETIAQQRETVGESMKRSSECITKITEKLKSAPLNLLRPQPLSYANAVKRSSGSFAETPRTAKVPYTPRTSQQSVTGKSSNIIGKPPSPTKPRIDRPKIEKAIWISRLHRDTTEEEMENYVKESFELQSTENIRIRKLVKRDRELSEYSFVSFSVACTAETFNVLMNIEKWPSYCQIREFELEPKRSTTSTSQSKNEKEDPNVKN